MEVPSIQERFTNTLLNGSLDESCLFEIDEKVGLSALMTLSSLKGIDWDRYRENALGWLKVQDKTKRLEHDEIIQTVQIIFNHSFATAFDCDYRGIRGKTRREYLVKAIQENNPEWVQELLNSDDLDPNAYQEGLRVTPLTMACQLGHSEVVRVLLQDRRVDPNKTGQILPFTPLYHAVFFRHLEVVKELLQHPELKLHGLPAKMIDVLTLSLVQMDKAILDLLSRDQRANFFSTHAFKEGTPIENVYRFGAHSLKEMATREYSVDEEADNASCVNWKVLGFVPVSNDKEHAPPDDFAQKLIKLKERNTFCNPEYGELKFVHFDEYTRVIYRTRDFVSLSLIRKNHPIGPTLYRPMSSIPKSISDPEGIWQIANQAINENPAVIHGILKALERRKWVVFRALNHDYDPQRIENKESLKGRGKGVNIPMQVQGKEKTALLSASTTPISKFVKGNGGYALIFTERGAGLVLGKREEYPAFIPHEQVMRSVQGRRTLEKRVKEAKECLFASPVPLHFVASLDNGYPTLQSRSKREKIEPPLPNSVRKFIEKHDLDLSQEEKNLIHQTGNKKARQKILNNILQNKKKSS